MKNFLRSLAISLLILACVLAFQRLSLPGEHRVMSFVEYVVTGEYDWGQLGETLSHVVGENLSRGASQFRLRINEIREVLAEKSMKYGKTN